MDELFGGLTDWVTTKDGDLQVSGNDIGTVAGIDWFTQEVNKILMSGNDWYFAPQSGASLDRFHGEINSKSTASQIQDLISNKIMQQGLHVPASLEVRVVPIDVSTIKVYINLTYATQVIPVTAVVFDLQNGYIKNTEVIQAQQDTRTPLKHPYAARFL